MKYKFKIAFTKSDMFFNISSFLFFIIFAFAHPLFAQKQISIIPSVGIAIPLCYTIDDANADSRFRANTFRIGESFSLNVSYPFNHKLKVYSGWRIGNDAITSIAYGGSQRYFGRGGKGTISAVNRFSLASEYNLTTISALELKNKMLYALLFRLNIIGGISYNKLLNTRENQGTTSLGNVTHFETYTNDDNFSVLLGLSFQFFNFDKEHFLLKIYYNQGGRELIRGHFEYPNPSRNYSATVGTRGSFIVAELGYPIRIKLNKSND
ncbi:MAG: hypothetical protein EBR30_11210 [Cytophagia bacterium]|nr:hypothetical protein [Cytophagia bacterium]NBW35564.1 hypothetical protein [Cytophagia bacterium]